MKLRHFPMAIRGSLVKTEIGWLTGPHIDGRNRLFSEFESIDGRKFKTSGAIGFNRPMESDYHAYYAFPNRKEMQRMTNSVYSRLLPPAANL